MSTVHIRPYRTSDAKQIITWCQDEETYYKWSAGILGPYPLTAERLDEKLSGRLDNTAYFPFTAFDETGPKGFFILRKPDADPVPEHVTLPQPELLRFGFVIVSPECRGKGYGKQMLQLGATFARSCYGAQDLSLGVFDNNPAALHCYEAVGFRQTGWKQTKPVMPGAAPWTVQELLWEAHPYIIETPRLLLRRYRPADFDSLYPILSDAETMAHYPAPFTEEQVHQWIIRNIKRYKNDGFGLWAVLLKNPDSTEGRCIGDCGLTIQNIDGQMLPEVGYHIAKDLWRQGYGKEAARAVRDWAFTNTTYDELWSWMKYTNEASQATARANGMTKIKEYADDVNGTSCAWRITRAEWETTRHQPTAQPAALTSVPQQLGAPTLIELATLEENCVLASQLGLQFIELNMNFPEFQVHDPKQFDLAAARKLAEHYHLYYTIHLPEDLNITHSNPLVRQAYLDTVLKTIDAATELHAPVINMHMNHGIYITLPTEKVFIYEKKEDIYLSDIAAFRQLAEDHIRATGQDILITIENTDGFKGFEKKAIDYLLESPVFALTWDIGHSASTDEKDLPFITARTQHLKHFHIHDGTDKAHGGKCHQQLGTGTIPLSERLNLATRCNARCVLETKTVEALKNSVAWLNSARHSQKEY